MLHARKCTLSVHFIVITSLKRHKQAFKNNTTTNGWFEIDVKSMWLRGRKNFLQSYRWLNLLVINNAFRIECAN